MHSEIGVIKGQGAVLGGTALIEFAASSVRRHVRSLTAGSWTRVKLRKALF